MDLCSVKRPDFGKLGRPLKVYANHFIVEVPKTGYFYHYDVTIELVKGEELDDAKVSPAGTPKRKLKEPSPLKDDAKASREPPRVSKELKRKIFRLFLQADPGKVMNGTKPAFDGEKNMYTMKELKIARGDSKSAEVCGMKKYGRLFFVVPFFDQYEWCSLSCLGQHMLRNVMYSSWIYV